MSNMPPVKQNFLMFYLLVHGIGSMKSDIVPNLSLANYVTSNFLENKICN